jgi:hypothetical protein
VTHAWIEQGTPLRKPPGTGRSTAIASPTRRAGRVKRKPNPESVRSPQSSSNRSPSCPLGSGGSATSSTRARSSKLPRWPAAAAAGLLRIGDSHNSTGYFGGCVSWPTCGWRDEVAVCDASSTNSCRSPSTRRRGGVLRRDLRSVNAPEECCWRCLARGESQGNVPELAHKPSRTLPSPIVYLLSLNTSPTWELLGYWCECNNCVISALRNTPIFCSFL